MRSIWISGIFLLFISASALGADLTREQVAEALARATASQPADFAGKSLEKLDLQKFNFTGAKLAGANLFGANLTDADFTGADLDGATLLGVKGLDTVKGLATALNFDKTIR